VPEINYLPQFSSFLVHIEYKVQLTIKNNEKQAIKGIFEIAIDKILIRLFTFDT